MTFVPSVSPSCSFYVFPPPSHSHPPVSWSPGFLGPHTYASRRVMASPRAFSSSHCRWTVRAQLRWTVPLFCIVSRVMLVQCCAHFLPARRPVPVQWSLLVCPESVLPTSIFMCQLDSSHACQRQARAVLEAMAPQSPPETQLRLLDVISLTSPSPSPSAFPSMAGNTREIWVSCLEQLALST